MTRVSFFNFSTHYCYYGSVTVSEEAAKTTKALGEYAENLQVAVSRFAAFGTFSTRKRSIDVNN